MPKVVFSLSRLILGVTMLSACRANDPQKTTSLAPAASALQAAPAPASAVHFRVDASTSRVSFSMDAPFEKIDGDASGGLTGDVFLNAAEISKSTALVKVDLQKLVLYQRKRAADQAAFSERTKNELQNQHARDWLQIVPHDGEVSAEQADANRWAEFKVQALEEASTTTIALATGTTRTFSANAVGEFRLHGRKLTKSATLEIRIDYVGNKPQSIHVKTREPFSIGLAEFEVNPRDGAGKFVKSVTEALSSNLKGKVAADAPLNLEFTAHAE